MTYDDIKIHKEPGLHPLIYSRKTKTKQRRRKCTHLSSLYFKHLSVVYIFKNKGKTKNLCLNFKILHFKVNFKRLFNFFYIV